MSTKPRTVRATVTPTGQNPIRLLFIECEQSNGDPAVSIYSATASHGIYRTERFGDRLGRAWVRAWAADAATMGVTVTFQ